MPDDTQSNRGKAEEMLATFYRDTICNSPISRETDQFNKFKETFDAMTVKLLDLFGSEDPQQ